MKSKHFKIHELVPQHIYEKYGEKAWRFIDLGLILSLDTLKERFPKGKITINNYYWGGNFKWSGLRTPDSPHYFETSMHSFGKAVDPKFSAYDSDIIRKDIIDNPNIYPYIKGLELDVNWVHIDTRNEDNLIKFRA